MKPLIIAALLAIAGCVHNTAERQLCDTRALTKAQLEADKYCGLDVPWDKCADAARIERELQSAMEACQ